jgi:hypothetical protein
MFCTLASLLATAGCSCGPRQPPFFANALYVTANGVRVRAPGDPAKSHERRLLARQFDEARTYTHTDCRRRMLPHDSMFSATVSCNGDVALGATRTRQNHAISAPVPAGSQPTCLVSSIPTLAHHACRHLFKGHRRTATAAVRARRIGCAGTASLPLPTNDGVLCRLDQTSNLLAFENEFGWMCRHEQSCTSDCCIISSNSLTRIRTIGTPAAGAEI